MPFGTDMQGGVLPSGVVIGFAGAGAGDSVGVFILYDYNGTAGPNVFGKDQLHILTNLGPGGPYWGVIPTGRSRAHYNGTGIGMDADNTALYNEVLGS